MEGFLGGLRLRESLKKREELQGKKGEEKEEGYILSLQREKRAGSRQGLKTASVRTHNEWGS